MFISGMCYCSKRSTRIWWHFLRSPSSHWIGWSLTNQAGLPGASHSGSHVQTAARAPTTPAQRTSLYTSSLPADLQGSAEGLAKVVPYAQFCVEWPGCGLPVRVDQKWRLEGGVCVCVCVCVCARLCECFSFLLIYCRNCWWCYDCAGCWVTMFL